jgi:non-specific serine/threonine protein kinase
VPLAIELAAARVAVLGVAEIAERLDARFRLLAEGPGGTAPQQETLRIALEWTYGLLSANDAALFRRMCVFTRATDVAGAEYVCAGEGLPRQAVAPGLASLVAKSLVACKAADLHIVVEPIRGYGCALLVESGESDMVGARHTDWWARRPIRLTLRTTEPLPEGASQ